MSLFSEAVRLVRTKWKDPNALAQELYTILRMDQSVSSGQQTVTDPRDSGSPLTIVQRADSPWPAITVVRGNESFPIDPFQSTGVGGVDLSNVDPGGDTIAADGTPTSDLNPISFYGVVSAKVSGETYKVAVWAKSPASSPAYSTISVRIPGIDIDEVLTPGTPLHVIAFPTKVNGKTTITDAVSAPPLFFPLPS